MNRAHTFPTAFVDLTFEEAKVLSGACKEYVRAQNRKNFEVTAPGLIAGSKVLTHLAARIDKTLAEHKFSTVMAKLDTRSPKDSALYNPSEIAYQQLVKNELRSLHLPLLGDVYSGDSANEIVMAFIRAQNRALAVCSGLELLKVFIHSFRISEDLSAALSYGKDFFDIQIVLREWDERVVNHPEGEFRCFVYKGQLNSATQYFTSVVFPELVSRKKAIGEQICQYFKKHVRDKLAETHESYVIDFLVLSQAPDDIKVVELNPFYASAGAGCFSWKDDRKQMMEGPFEIRVVEQKPSSAGRDYFDNWIPLRWREFVCGLVEERKNSRRLKLGAAFTAFAVGTVAVAISFLRLRRRR
mmetsp:Transcript_47023/g.78025  ORF Transcript_47023/g.78025 Transcript_47023/m.78025 type:complete len:356 (+) Transcript_47023:118-1185(+)